MGNPNAILVVTGRLERSAEMAVRNTFKMETKIKWVSLIDKCVSYAEVHQFGDARNYARPFMNDPVDAELEPAYNLAQTFLDKEIDRIMGSGM
jgi:hypothetical protein